MIDVPKTRTALEWQAREMEEGWHPEIPLEIAERADLFRALSAALGRAQEAWQTSTFVHFHRDQHDDPAVWSKCIPVLIVPIEEKQCETK